MTIIQAVAGQEVSGYMYKSTLLYDIQIHNITMLTHSLHLYAEF